MKTLKHWKDFFAFVKNPNYSVKEEGIKNKVLLSLNTFILKILIFIPVLVIFVIFSFLTNSLTGNDNMLENVKSMYHPVVLFTLVAIFEELFFRSALDKFRALYFSISVVGIMAYFSKKIMYRNMFFEPEGLLTIGLIAIPVFLITFFIANHYKVQLATFWEKNFKYIFYIGSFLFAFVHFFNSESLDVAYLKTIVFQFMTALFLGFVRIRAGLVFAILLHFIWDIML